MSILGHQTRSDMNIFISEIFGTHIIDAGATVITVYTHGLPIIT